VRNAKQNSSSGARVTESEENTGVTNSKESRMKMLFVNLFIAEVSIELIYFRSVSPLVARAKTTAR
jgi:hypothetical protein